jgi:AcrR family transcriptional regulator
LTTVKQTKPPRRTQQDRSASTRARLLDAAINSLHTRGYAATTTMIVSEDAGVSRGAMLHQFPTKVDLMLYVVKAVYEEEVRLYQEALETIPDPRERVLAFPRVLWEILSRPAGIAVLEIMQGSRSDPTLAERLKPLQREIEQDSFKRAGSMIVGKHGAKASAVSVRLMVWAIRGLSVASMLTDEPEEVEKSVKLLQSMLAAALDQDVLRIPSSAATPAHKKKRQDSAA